MKYRKKPVVIEAIQYTGENIDELSNFVGDHMKYIGFPKHSRSSVIIHTLEGDMEAKLGDYIIKGVDGEFYPCKPNIFEKTYEVAE